MKTFQAHRRRVQSLLLLGGLVLVAAAGFAQPAQAAFYERVPGVNRYSASAAIAREGFDPKGDHTWPGVDTIVIASGEDRATPDVLAAAGLCGAYDAPLLLVNSREVPSPVAKVISEVRSANTTVTVFVIGGRNSVPDAVWNRLGDLAGSPLRYAPGSRSSGDRYSTAVAVSQLIWVKKQGDASVVFIANGENPGKFWDSVAASSASANMGFPVLFVRRDDIPASTLYELKNRGFDRAIVIGGPASVSDRVLSEVAALPGLQVERWAGDTRYTTAVEVADKAISAGFSDGSVVGIAAKLPDGFTGGAMVGRSGGVFLPTASDSLPSPVRSWLEDHVQQLEQVYLFGEQASVSEDVFDEIATVLSPYW